MALPRAGRGRITSLTRCTSTPPHTPLPSPRFPSHHFCRTPPPPLRYELRLRAPNGGRSYQCACGTAVELAAWSSAIASAQAAAPPVPAAPPTPPTPQAAARSRGGGGGGRHPGGNKGGGSQSKPASSWQKKANGSYSAPSNAKKKRAPAAASSYSKKAACPPAHKLAHMCTQLKKENSAKGVFTKIRARKFIMKRMRKRL